MFIKRVKQRTVLIALIVALCVIAVALALYFALRPADAGTEDTLPPSPSVLGIYSKAAVSTNGVPCAEIGKNILAKNGSAVEAAIAALFCEGVACLQSMGLGGGFFMVIYDREKREIVTLNARETAPAAAHEDMFNGNSSLSQNSGLAVAVPGELMGYWEAFQKYKSGNVRWEELIEPTIKLCIEGVEVTPYLEAVLRNNEKEIMASDSMREILVNPETGELLKVGERIKRPKLAQTLRKIAENGSADIFYHGELGAKFVEDVKGFGGIITQEDLANYTVMWENATKVVLKGNVTMYSMPPPGSGILLTFMLNILSPLLATSNPITNYHHITEAFKFAYGKRTELGDPQFVDISSLVQNLTSPSYADLIRSSITDDKTFQDPSHYGSVLYQPNDHGTAHISVLAPNGDAVSVTSTVNLILGAVLRSQQTGIILNNEMDDFSAPNITNAFGVPPSPNNFIKPGKRPLSSMCPAIFIDCNDNVRLVVGAAGGTKITTATALASLFNLYFNMDIKEALDARRIHHQLFPMTLQYEEGFLEKYVKGLEAIGHKTEKFAVGGSSVTAISVEDEKVYANSDFRRGGTTSGF
ncbi:scoloptoxin SSD14 [Anabrus simplex]|uniref:scoloptoxin SSD14 n=1 Tax=Anabrus simplex TaxID=316456 RepID=UPI0035A27969